MGSEELFPPDWHEVSDVESFGGGDPLEHINKVGIRIDMDKKPD